MFKWLTNRSQLSRIARELYGGVVAQARNRAFYSDLNVADTPEGRYELIALHLILTLERLGQSDVADEPLRRATLEAFITDLDDAMREFGVGVDSVSKRVKRAAGGVHDRSLAYRAALAEATNSALETALIKHVYQGRNTVLSQVLASYVRAAIAELSAQSADALRQGIITFPHPDRRS